VSLIDEALKRARAEAARQKTAERGAASRWVPSHPLTRRRRRPLLWAGLAAGCLAAGVAVGLAVAALSGGEGGEDRGRDGCDQVAAAAPAAVEEKDQVGRDGSATLVEEPAAGAAGAAPTDAFGTSSRASTAAEPVSPRGSLRGENARGEAMEGTGDRLAPQRDREAPERTAPPRVPSPPSSSSAAATPPASEPPADRSPSSLPSPSSAVPPAPETPAAGSSDPRGAAAATPPAAPEGPAATYVRRAPLPGGGAIALGGIAFSTNPVALLNGKVVGIGEVVDGMTVVAIAPGRVDLEGRGTRLALLIK